MENKPLGLKLSSDFSNLQKTGKRKVLSPWLMVSYKPNEIKTLRFGCTISKKVGSAVIRNRLKRWTREYFLKLFKELSNPNGQSAKNENSLQIDINLVFRARSDEFYKKLNFDEFCQTMESFFKHRR